MAQTLEYNASIKQVSAVQLPVFNEDMDIIQKLDDEPNDVGGLTAEQLKAEFDSAGKKTKEYINNELIPAIIAESLTEEARANAEAERVANEQERVANEQVREAGENTRNENFVAMQAEVDDVLALVEKMAVAVGTLPSSSPATVAISKDSATGGYKITFGIPRGEDGKDGDGSGDMKKSVYDPKGKQTDVFKYVDDALAKIPAPDVSAQIEAHNASAEAHKDVLAPMYTYGTEDLRAGVTPLESGKLHFVYE